MMSRFHRSARRIVDVHENNFLEVMQFVFNHTTFDPKEEPVDQDLLVAFKPLVFFEARSQEYSPGTTRLTLTASDGEGDCPPSTGSGIRALTRDRGRPKSRHSACSRQKGEDTAGILLGPAIGRRSDRTARHRGDVSSGRRPGTARR